MNLQNRISKLEGGSNKNGAFCSCPGEPRIRVIYPDLDRTEEEYEALIEEAMKPQPCDRCSRPIETQLIDVQYVEEPIRHEQV